MQLFCYVDDSGTHANSPIYVLGGFIASAETWAAFTLDWQAVLKEEPSVAHLHTADAYSLLGAFSNWTSNQVDKKLFHLAEAIEKHGLRRFDTSILRKDYDDLIHGQFVGPVGKDPYFLAYYRIVTALAREPTLSGHAIQLVFDEQGGSGVAAIEAWTLLCEVAPSVYETMPRPRFGNDLSEPPLQAADLYVWHARRYLLEKLEGKSPERHMHIHRRFLGLPYLPLPINRDELLDLACGLLVSEIRWKFE